MFTWIVGACIVGCRLPWIASGDPPWAYRTEEYSRVDVRAASTDTDGGAWNFSRAGNGSGSLDPNNFMRPVTIGPTPVMIPAVRMIDSAVLDSSALETVAEPDLGIA